MIPTPETEIIKEYLHKYPSMTSSAIAELLFTTYPELYKSKESIRSRIRWFRGTKANEQGLKIAAERIIAKIDIPEPLEEEKFGFVTLDNSAYPLLLGADAHIPFHDREAIEMFIEYGLTIKPKTIILLGDWMDCYSLSKFITDPRLRDIYAEIKAVKQIMGELRRNFPTARIIYKFGNHEDRYEDYLKMKAPELFSVDALRLENILGLEKDFNIETVRYKRVIQLNNLYMIHGHEYKTGISAPVNPARGLYLRTKKTAICAHYHQTSDHTEPSINGEIEATWTLGCLCGLHPQYAPLNKWNLGFADVQHVEDTMFAVNNRKIVNYRLV